MNATLAYSPQLRANATSSAMTRSRAYRGLINWLVKFRRRQGGGMNATGEALGLSCYCQAEIRNERRWEAWMREAGGLDSQDVFQPVDWMRILLSEADE
ncbi:hypothetical protein HJFPF1_05171 [Paramyrothecium foliicola]|nr:hypothetical protein HJFPF1_05171 [Paramyrothecium foliicola]